MINSWAILQKESDREKLEAGARMIKMVVREAFSRLHGWAPGVARLEV